MTSNAEDSTTTQKRQQRDDIIRKRGQDETKSESVVAGNTPETRNGSVSDRPRGAEEHRQDAGGSKCQTETKGNKDDDGKSAVATPTKKITADKKSAKRDVVMRKIFVGGLPYRTKVDELRRYFTKFGDVVEAVIPRDKITFKSRGFGFVTFRKASSADAVLNATTQHKIENKPVEVKRAIPRDRASYLNVGSNERRVSRRHHDHRDNGSSPPTPNKDMNNDRKMASSSSSRGQRGGSDALSSTTTSGNAPLVRSDVSKIFVGGLHSTVVERPFRAYFEKFGKVVDAVVMIDRNTKRSRGFGFITFDRPEGVKRAMEAGPHELNGKRVEIKIAEPHRPLRARPRRGGRFQRGGTSTTPPVVPMDGTPTPLDTTNSPTHPHMYAVGYNPYMPIMPYGGFPQYQGGYTNAYMAYQQNGYGAYHGFMPMNPPAMDGYGFPTTIPADDVYNKSSFHETSGNGGGNRGDDDNKGGEMEKDVAKTQGDASALDDTTNKQ